MRKQPNFLKVPGFLVLGLLVVSLVSGCGGNRERKTIKIGHVLDQTHPVHKAMEHMAKRVKEKSGGKLQIDIYPNGQLGSERECLELLQIGSLGMTKVSAATMEGFSKKWRAISMPYIFQNDAHRFKVLESEVGQELLLSAQDQWLRGICFYDAGSRSFYTKSKPIKKPSDLKGVKVRTMSSQTAIKMVDMMGGSAQVIDFGELYTAIQQGTVDGAENNPPSFHLSRHYEVAKHYSLDKHSSIPDVLIMSTKVWNRLTQQEQEWVMEAARESVQLQKKLWAEATEEALKKVKEAGVKVYRPNKEPFRKAVQPMHQEYMKKYPKIGRLMKKIKAMK